MADKTETDLDDLAVELLSKFRWLNTILNNAFHK